jgi:predicted acylesterase/phospholipase RssA
MARPTRLALVLQGGGALGAFEFGAARALYEQNFRPDVIAGVSIGAITAVLLARPVRRLGPLRALEAFWNKVTVSAYLVPQPLRSYASFLGNPHFFRLRPDFFNWPFAGFFWTHFYETQPLKETLKELVDLEELMSPAADPLLLLSATNVKEGRIEYFDSRKGGLTLDHILASCSLPPAFPMTRLGDKFCWDGGLFDNTPLGAVLDRLDQTAGAERIIYVVNLFPNKGPVPENMIGVAERMKNLQFANKTFEDLKLLSRFNEVAELMEALETLPQDHPLRESEAYNRIKNRRYIHVPRIVSITPPGPSPLFGDADFSPEAIEHREKQGHAEATKALSAGSREC